MLRRCNILFLCSLLFVFSNWPLACASDGSLPPSLSAAILIRVISFEELSKNEKDISIHILDEGILSEEIKAHVNARVGSGRLARVTVGADIPDALVDVVVITKASQLEAALEYTERFGSISVGMESAFAERGVSLTIYDDEGMPGILLNRGASDKEGLRWEPEILQVAKVIGD